MCHPSGVPNIICLTQGLRVPWRGRLPWAFMLLALRAFCRFAAVDMVDIVDAVDSVVQAHSRPSPLS